MPARNALHAGRVSIPDPIAKTTAEKAALLTGQAMEILPVEWEF
jgi:hypothetical protein